MKTINKLENELSNKYKEIQNLKREIDKLKIGKYKNKFIGKYICYDNDTFMLVETVYEGEDNKIVFSGIGFYRFSLNNICEFRYDTGFYIEIPMSWVDTEVRLIDKAEFNEELKNIITKLDNTII